MKLRTLDASEENLMLELLASEKASIDTDFYLDRGRSFWAPYSWFSKDNHFSLGVFENGKLVGMVVIIKLPFLLKGADSEIYLATDMLIRPEFRKSFAAARLFTGLHTHLPSEDFINLWIENRPGFAEAVPKFSKRLNRATVQPRETNLVTFYPNQNIEVAEKNITFDLTEDWTRINIYLEEYRKHSHSWVDWPSEIELKKVFKRVVLFTATEGDTMTRGLIIDRGNLQTVRWNGQPRLIIEKYRRSLSQKSLSFSKESELPFANVVFALSSKKNFISQAVVENICRWGFENNYFGVNFRDLNVASSKQVDRAEFPRRIFLSTSQSELFLQHVSKRLPRDGVTVESIYL